MRIFQNYRLRYGAEQGLRSIAYDALEQGASVNTRSALTGRTPLMSAIRNQDHRLERVLTEHGAVITDDEKARMLEQVRTY